MTVILLLRCRQLLFNLLYPVKAFHAVTLSIVHRLKYSLRV
jgi:hypothetical protein